MAISRLGLGGAMTLVALTVATLGTACSSPAIADEREADDEVEVADGVVVASRDVVRDVVVRPDALLLPLESHEDMKATEPGTILVGADAGEGSQNPMGFARRVKAVRVEGGFVVIETDRVGLTDLFRGKTIRVEAAPRGGPGQASVRPRSVPSSSSRPPPADAERYDFAFDTKLVIDEASGAMINAKVAFSDAYAWLDVEPPRLKATTHEDGTLESVVYEIPVHYDAGLEFCGEISAVTGVATRTTSRMFGKKLFGRYLGRYIIPVAQVPVVVTVYAEARVSCRVRGGTSATVTGRYRVYGEPTLGLSYSDEGGASIEGFDSDDLFHQEGEIDAEVTASSTIRCGVEPKIGVYLYDLVGPYAAIEPRLDFSASIPDVGGDDARPAACLSLNGSIGGSLGVELHAFGRSLDRSKYLTFESRPLEIWSTCVSKDSCAGRVAGWYCSEIASYSAIECDGDGSTISGYQCGQGHCQPSGPTRNDPAQMDGDRPRCGPAPSRSSTARLSCPPVPPTEHVPLFGPCDEARVDEGRAYCDPLEPHVIYHCVDGGQTTEDCGADYCMPAGNSYENPAQGRFGSLDFPTCHASAHSCSGALEEGWYRSSLDPSVAIWCPRGGGNPYSSAPLETHACGAGSECAVDPGGAGRALRPALVERGRPVCVPRADAPGAR